MSISVGSRNTEDTCTGRAGGGGLWASRSWASGLGFMQGPEPQTRKALTPAIMNGLHHGYADILSEANRV